MYTNHLTREENWEAKRITNDVWDDCIANDIGGDEAIYAYEEAWREAVILILSARRAEAV